MHIQSLYLAFLASASSVVANEVVSIFLPQADPQPLVGKVIGVDDSATTYVLNCAPGTDEDECGLPSTGFTVAQGPSTYRMVYSYEDYVQSQGCKIGNKSIVTCDLHMHDATTTHSEHAAALTTTNLPFLPVTITATETGATNKATASASSASATAAAKSTLTTTASATSGASASATSASSSATNSSNAAMAQVTGHAGWIAGGAAMAMAVAMA